MKKLMVFALFLVVMITVMVADVPAKAVKLPLYDAPYSRPTGDEPQVGWAIVNINANNELIVEVHLNDGAPNQDLAIYVDEYDANGNRIIHPPPVVAEMTTNKQGNGNGHGKLSLNSATEQIAIIIRDVPISWELRYITLVVDIPLEK